MEELEGRWVVEEEQKDDGQADVDDVDVETPSPTKTGVIDKCTRYKRLVFNESFERLTVERTNHGTKRGNGSIGQKYE